MAWCGCLRSTHTASTWTGKLKLPKSVNGKPHILDKHLPSRRLKDTQEWKRKTMYYRFNETELSRDREGAFDDDDQITKEISLDLPEMGQRGKSDKTILGSSDKHSYFSKRARGPRLLVLYDFVGEAEDDLSVAKGELVHLLNSDDKEWFWVKNSRNEEGFVPRNFVNEHVCEDCRRNLFKRRPSSMCSESESCQSSTLHSSSSSSSSSGIESTRSGHRRLRKLKSSNLLVTCDYHARTRDELSVHKGDTVMANLKDQVAMKTGWVWVYSPKQKCSGYIPEKSLEINYEITI